jgi:hypothetical protein
MAEMFTARGFVFLLVGNAFGAVLAGTVFSISVVGVPYLHDKPVDFMTAIMTSVHAVAKNPWPMLVWGLIVAVYRRAFSAGLLLPADRHAADHRPCDLASLSPDGGAQRLGSRRRAA